MVVVGCCFVFFSSCVLSFDISLFMDGWMEEGSVSAGMIAFYVS